MDIDRNKVVAALGGEEAVARMSHEQRADGLEQFMSDQLDSMIAARKPGKHYKTVADHEALIDTRGYRRGIGHLFIHPRSNKRPDEDTSGLKVKRLPPMPAAPTLADVFNLRLRPANHLLQSARLARKKGAPEETILGCLLHDLGNYLIRSDHGYWGAQIVEPYVSERVAFAIRYHQALRFFPDPEIDYTYPEGYLVTFGVDYRPAPHVIEAYKFVRNHKWYDSARLVTANDYYAFDPDVVVEFEEFEDIVGRHFKQPKEGLGNDNSPVAHMWRTFVNPDAPL